MGSPSVTVIVPTFREADNLPPLLARIAAVREAHELDLNVLLMDDDSRDGTAEAVAASALSWVTLVVRDAANGDKPGLSEAVVAGMQRARGDMLVVMDADTSHPPERIPDLLDALSSADISVGSRYTDGGSTDDDWGTWRLFKSRVATSLVRPLTAVRDPMAGFFAIRRADAEQARGLRPVGYKILLELIVRCAATRPDFRVVEVPIHFSDRAHGQSKLTTKQELLFLEHLRRLYCFRAQLIAEALFASRTTRGDSPSA